MVESSSSIITSIPLPVPTDPDYTYPSSILTPDFKVQHLQTKVTHYALIIPVKQTSKIRKSLSTLLLQRPKMKDVYELSEDDYIDGVDPKMERKIVLNDVAHKKEEEGSVYAHELIQSILSNNNNIRKAKHDIIISYNHYTVEQTLTRILPPTLHKEIPSSFEVIGSIAHFNLRPEYIPYKFLIGRIVLDKIKSIKVCVNKIGSIQNEFRTFPMEIIADDRIIKKGSGSDGSGSSDDKPRLEVEVKEDGCKFKLDFENVYWNSRLQHEHRRIVRLISGKERLSNLQQRKHKKQKLNQDQNQQQQQQQQLNQNDPSSMDEKDEIIVADACAGIGPFAIPLTSQYDHIKVYANDLNPTSYKYLNINAKLNKCHVHNNLQTYNMDGRDFIRKLDDEGIHYDHVLMNLPAIAPEFLNVFRGWKNKDDDLREGQAEDYDKGNHKQRQRRRRPMVHVHCFGGKDEKAENEAIERCSKSLGCALHKEKDEVNVQIVRDVSPKKNMLCVSFRIPRGVEGVERVDKFGPVVVTEDNNGNDGEEENDEDDKKSAVKRPRTEE